MGNWRSKPTRSNQAAVIRHYRTDDGLYECIVGDGVKSTVTCYKDKGPQEYEHMKGIPRCSFHYFGAFKKEHSPCTHLSQSMWVQLEEHQRNNRLQRNTPELVDEIVTTHSKSGDWCPRCMSD